MPDKIEKPSKANKKETIKFEKSLQQLQDVVAKLESGELSLEQSVAMFEKGMELANICNKALTQAEQKVQVLLEKNGAIIKEDLNHYNSDTDSFF